MAVRRELDLSIIIVNWNSKDYLERCLESLMNASLEMESEIIVVDNASYDGSKEMMKRHFPYYRYLQSDVNGGFSYGNNLGASNANGNVVLFLNPDTKVLDNSITKVFDLVTHNEHVGIASCVLLNSDGSIQDTCVQTYPTILNQVLDSEWLRKIFPKSSLWGNEVLLAEDNHNHKVEALSGAFLMLKKDIFEEVGGFNELYFMYAEDIDLCFRVNQAGYDVVLVRSSNIVHYGGGSNTDELGNRFGNVMMRDSIYKYLGLHRSKFYAFLYRTAMIFNALLRILTLLIISSFHILLRRRIPKGPLAKWFYILSWSLGGEGWRRKYLIST